MRDGATGRSRGFGFLTFKDPKTVNIVMVKEHSLDGKLVSRNRQDCHARQQAADKYIQIDPKRAIPREEQERTAKIFVGGVSQECTEIEFKEFFQGFGRVLDATLMMDKNTGRPRGFGFVTFDSDAAVDRTLEHPLSIHDKYVEIKRAEPRGNMRDDEGGHGRGAGGGRGGRGGFGGGGGFANQGGHDQMNQNGGGAAANGMSQAQMAQSWARMQQYFQAMQQNMAMQSMGGMNPALMQQMMAQRGMNPQQMQQMQQMQQQQQQGGMGGQGMGGQGMQGGGNQGQGMGGSPMNGGPGQSPGPQGLNAQEQLMFEQQKYERQTQARMQQGNFQGGNTWDGMYDDVPAPVNLGRGGFNGGGNRGRGGRGSSQGPAPGPAPNAPAGAPTGPKNAGIPGANYRGGGRGGRRGYHP